MYIENITFEKDDTREQTLTKIVQIYCGTTELKTQLKRKGITNYVRVDKGAKVSYILRGKGIEKLTVKL